MADHHFGIPSRPGRCRTTHQSGVFGEIKSSCTSSSPGFDPYRPELHYMRGPGPACRAKDTALSPGGANDALPKSAPPRLAKSHASS